MGSCSPLGLFCQDVATMIRYGQNPIIFLINNGGCALTRP